MGECFKGKGSPSYFVLKFVWMDVWDVWMVLIGLVKSYHIKGFMTF